MIPISRPTIGDDELRLVSEAVSSGWVSSQGPFIEQFEREFAEFCGVKHCIATANGTVAIHLALDVLRIGKGDEVIVPDLTFVATANAVALTGARPMLADVLNSSWCMDPASVERLITPQTRALIPVHLYGHPCAMDELCDIARRHGLLIIEDAAEAHGAKLEGRRVGSLGDCATFSFYANKIITTGEGGAITTDSDELAERSRFLRDHGMSRVKRYWHTEVAYNYRMTNMQAALGVAQLGHIDEFMAERDRILEAYSALLEPHGLTVNPRLPGTRPVNWMTCVLLPGFDRAGRDMVIDDLRGSGVDSRPFFFPLSDTPMYEQASPPVASHLSACGLNLPTFPGLTDQDIGRVASALLDALARAQQGPATPVT